MVMGWSVKLNYMLPTNNYTKIKSKHIKLLMKFSMTWTPITQERLILQVLKIIEIKIFVKRICSSCNE